MSNAALVQERQEVRATPEMILVPAKQELSAAEFDPNPLITVLVAIIIALAGAATFVGVIVMWLALRHSGVMAP